MGRKTLLQLFVWANCSYHSAKIHSKKVLDWVQNSPVEIVRTSYDHLNETDFLSISIGMDELAQKIEALNYGTVRFLAALIKARNKSPKSPNPDVLMLAIGKLIKQGLD